MKFKNESSPFMFAQLILEVGTEQLDRATPDLDDPTLETALDLAIEKISQVYDLRRKKLSRASGM
ncbi:MAG: hypothetical protein U0165_11330 [Polyangiaceae bacterium]